MSRTRTSIAVIAGVAAVAVLAAACSSSAASGGTKSGAGKGPLAGKTVWYADVTDSNRVAVAIAQAFNKRITEAGGQVVRSLATNPTTGAIDLATQAAGFDRGVVKKPAAMAYFVLDPKSMRPQVQRASRSGIPVFAAFGKPQGFDVNAYIDLPSAAQGTILAKYLASKVPAGSQVALIAGAPTPNTVPELNAAEVTLRNAGLKVVGSQDQQRNLTDDSAGGAKVMQSILQRFPDVKGIFAYNDPSALGAISVARAANKKIVIVSRNGSDDAVAAIKNGTLAATCDIDPIGLGTDLANAVIRQLSGAHDYEHTAQIPAPDPSRCLIDASNVNTFVSPTKRFHFVKIPQG